MFPPCNVRILAPTPTVNPINNIIKHPSLHKQQKNGNGNPEEWLRPFHEGGSDESEGDRRGGAAQYRGNLGALVADRLSLWTER